MFPVDPGGGGGGGSGILLHILPISPQDPDTVSHDSSLTYDQLLSPKLAFHHSCIDTQQLPTQRSWPLENFSIPRTLGMF